MVVVVVVVCCCCRCSKIYSLLIRVGWSYNLFLIKFLQSCVVFAVDMSAYDYDGDFGFLNCNRLTQ